MLHRSLPGPTPAAPMTLFQLTYISRSTERFSARDLPELLEAARAKNLALDLTGALYFAAGRFIQVLEGEEAVVRKLYATILRDPRHTEVETVAARAIDERAFLTWRMGALSASLAARAAKEAFRLHRTRETTWSEETLDQIIEEFQLALRRPPPT